MNEPADSGERVVPMRLQKFLARAGVASRRGSEDLITAGRVAVNGAVITELGARVDPLTDRVTVDGETVDAGGESVYLLLHKPADVVTTMSDPQGRRSIREFMPDGVPGLFPVGRLDRDTTGALLLTTDGELAHRLMHPRYHVPKRYVARVQWLARDEELDPLRTGIVLDDGPTKPARARVVEAHDAWSEVEVEVSEGRKRQVKRMFEAIGHPVLTLHREAFGPLELGDLPEGAWRELTAAEVAVLRESMTEDEG